MIILSAVIWYIYSKTTLGYKIKMVGLNKTNAKYVGVNEKLMTVFVMASIGCIGCFWRFLLHYFKRR
ncbi:ABC transporter permease subunit [Mycoplasmopsis felis]|uniref:ABC transporter permease subunit n=1 Tax=Mycoplasmopsis felis TaxID=33923 RepID=UPI003A5C7D1D